MQLFVIFFTTHVFEQLLDISAETNEKKTKQKQKELGFA